MTLRKILLMIIASIFVIIISACNGDSVEEQIYDHLEETVVLEEEFHTYKDEITALETEEQDIYQQIVDLTSDEFDDIQKLSNNALDIIEQRSNYLEKEKESIETSEEEFQQTKKLIEDLKDEGVKNKAQEMYEVMIERYRSYEKLYDSYKHALTLEEDLYTLLQSEDASQKDITNKVSDINEAYQEVEEAVDVFSEHTNKYNELKKEFYKKADLNVVFEED